MALGMMDPTCPDLNPAVRCNDHCMEIYTHCHFECDRETACEFQCYADLDVCLRSCPCFEDCPAGCEGCDSEFCICAEPESNSDFVNCQKAAETEYHQCAFNCPIDDIHCISDCSRKYHEKYEKCPCQSECPRGCPCPEYECTAETTSEISTTSSTTSTTTTTIASPTTPEPSTTLLVLNDYYIYNEPILIDVNGRQDTDFQFSYNKNEFHDGCSLTFQNEAYFFGGATKPRQILQLKGCEVVYEGDLPFDLTKGACTTTQDTLFLGFPNTTGQEKNFYRSEGPFDEYTKTTSIHNHNYGQIAASDYKVLAAGSFATGKSEIFTIADAKFAEIAPFPKRVSGKSVIYHAGYFYVFGGTYGNVLYTEIYSTPESGTSWTQRGSLNAGRDGHRSVIVDSSILVIGGSIGITEKCNLPEDGTTAIRCNTQTPDLGQKKFYSYPEIFEVPVDFCK